MTRIDADENAEVLRGYVARDDGAARLGEVALVDGDGRIGELDTVFFDTLLDENAASHIALGQAYAFTAGEQDRDRLNRSAIHVDFMIGGDGVYIAGSPTAATRCPCCREAPGSSELGFRRSRRGAGAVERARLEIA